jgi:DNA-directed RNA polymerase subunit RPC12/RpoP
MRDEICSFFKSDIPFIGICEVGPMGEHQKECQECGWRGLAAELDETNNASSGNTQIFCPDCGGKELKDLNPDEPEQTSES